MGNDSVIKYIQVVGLQRSGTTWLHSLLKHNFVVSMLPVCYGPPPLPSSHFVLTVVIKKDLDKWLDSIERNHANFYEWYPELYAEGGLNTPALKDLHQEFYDKWSDCACESSNVVFVNYLDLLGNTEAFLEQLQRDYDLRDKSDWTGRTSKWLTNIGPPFSHKRRAYYLRGTKYEPRENQPQG